MINSKDKMLKKPDWHYFSILSIAMHISLRKVSICLFIYCPKTRNLYQSKALKLPFILIELREQLQHTGCKIIRRISIFILDKKLLSSWQTIKKVRLAQNQQYILSKPTYIIIWFSKYILDNIYLLPKTEKNYLCGKSFKFKNLLN